MRKTLLGAFFLLLLSSGRPCMAADLTGTWNTTTKLADGSRHESTLNLQESGGRLTGKIVSKRGTAEIKDGTVSGDQVSFTVVRAGNGDELTIRFIGTVQGDTMKLRMEYRDHSPVKLTAKRAS